MSYHCLLMHALGSPRIAYGAWLTDLQEGCALRDVQRDRSIFLYLVSDVFHRLRPTLIILILQEMTVIANDPEDACLQFVIEWVQETILSHREQSCDANVAFVVQTLLSPDTHDSCHAPDISPSPAAH